MVWIEEKVKQKVRIKMGITSKYILMIDDDPLTNFINKKLLLHMGASAIIQTFDCAIDALESIQKLNSLGNSVGEVCILLDLQMVEMDGYEFLKRLKKMDLNIDARVYIVSGSMPVNHIHLLKSLSIAGFFLKPLTKGNVREVLMPEYPVYFNK